jgi:antitoxin ParD1/3/4
LSTHNSGLAEPVEALAFLFAEAGREEGRASTSSAKPGILLDPHKGNKGHGPLGHETCAECALSLFVRIVFTAQRRLTAASIVRKERASRTAVFRCLVPIRPVLVCTRSHQKYEADVGAVRKTITLTEQQDAWIESQIAAGLYTNDSEAIRDLIRREQERSFEIETIRQALIEGEQSGEPERFDFAAFKQRKAAQNG